MQQHRKLVGECRGGVFNSGRLTVSSSAVTGNRVPAGPPGSGGGIDNENGGVTMVSSSTIAGNSANFGAGIANGYGSFPPAILTVTDSTIFANTTTAGGWGGGIHNWASATVTNSTISRNQGGSLPGGFGGGGIFNIGGTLTVNNSTITGNSAGNPGGSIYVAGPGGGGSMSARNTIIAGNTAAAGPDVFGNLGSRGHNLIGNPQDMSGWVATDILHVNPRLGPLQDNGGPTLTHALMPGSPALDAGNNTDAPEFDQRGLPRVVAGAIDIGAYEVEPGPATWFWLEAPSKVAAGMLFDVTLYALDDYGHLATGYEGTVTFYTTDKDPGVVLPADYTFTADDQGMHTFAGETVLVTPGEQYLSAVDLESGLYAETAVTVVPSGASGSSGGWPRAVPYGSVVADLAFIGARRRIQSKWIWTGLLEQQDR